MNEEDFTLPVDDFAAEPAIEIDIGAMDTDAESEARDILDTVEGLYMDEQFKHDNPRLHKRIELEYDTLRGLLKMRKADETAHDAILMAISENKSNVVMYRSLAEIQRSSIAISNKIHDTIARMDDLCKTYKEEHSSQLIEEDIQVRPTTHRGSKSFIKDMLDEEL